MQESIRELKSGEFSWKGYVKTIRDYVCKFQLYDENTWKLFVNQYRKKADSDFGWRGEYWGKTMRGACLTYQCKKDKKLYRILESSVRELLSVQEGNGRFSTYPIDKEFSNWDMWCRKYVLLGNIYFYEICEDERLKEELLKALSRHLDYIIEHVGKLEGQVGILDTSEILEGLNSSSILEPVVKMYELTHEKRYLDFAEYIISCGFTKSQNLIEFLSEKKNYPYQCNVRKAYEMMSCFQGLYEYALLTNHKKYMELVENFVEKIHESDITIIGTSACDGEFFDHSATTQTDYNEENMQETCVTVTWVNLCFQLLKHTGNSKFADYIEKAIYNAMYGSVNLLNQRAKYASVWNGASQQIDTDAHETFPFDSYSPLYMKRRGTGIGGFNRMEAGRSYGCCACIGSAGTALGELYGILKNENTLFINRYSDCLVDTYVGENRIKLKIKNSFSKGNRAVIRVSGNGRFAVALRLPYWADGCNVYLDKKLVRLSLQNGYYVLENTWTNSEIEIVFDVGLKTHRLNGKIAFSYGPYVLARDERFNENIEAPFDGTKDFGWKIVKNRKFQNNLTLKIKNVRQEITVCDYASAGKNFDDVKSRISVWLEEKTEKNNRKII